jgi:hypothetical protein
MPLDFAEEPYPTLISLLRSEIGDLLIGDIDPSEFESDFTDEQLAVEINNAWLLRVRRDFQPGDVVFLDGNLSENILNSEKLTSATILAAAKRSIDILAQEAAGENVTIQMRGRKINFTNLVKGLQDSAKLTDDKYKEAILATTVGHVILP